MFRPHPADATNDPTPLLADKDEVDVAVANISITGDNHILEPAISHLNRQKTSDASSRDPSGHDLVLNWRPQPLRSPYLIFITMLSVTLAVAQEVVYQHAHRLATHHRGMLNFHNVEELTFPQYFMWRYLLPVVIISYGTMVGAVDHQLMRMAPFYKLNRRCGLSGNDTFLRDPISYITYLRRPIKAGPLVWVSALTTVLATVVAPVAQSYVFQLKSISTTNPQVQLFQVLVAPVWSRLLTTTLALVACCSIALHIMLWRRSSGLSSDPGGLYGVVAMVVNGDVLHSLERFSADVNDNQLGATLSNCRFSLRQGSIHRLTGVTNDTLAIGRSDSKAPPRRLCMSIWYTWGMLLFGFIIVMLCALFIIVMHISLVSAVTAVVYKFLWSQVDVLARITEPYWQLSISQAPPSTLFVDYAGLPTIALPFTALRHRRWTLCFVGVCSVLAEVLIICMSSISELLHDPSVMMTTATGKSAQGVAIRLLWASVSMGVLIPLIMSICLILVWYQRRHFWLPRAPGKLASLLVYVHSTRLVRSIEMTSRTASQREQQSRLQTAGKRYALGYFDREDGTKRIAIDEEPRSSFCFYEPPLPRFGRNQEAG